MLLSSVLIWVWGSSEVDGDCSIVIVLSKGWTDDAIYRNRNKRWINSALHIICAFVSHLRLHERKSSSKRQLLLCVQLCDAMSIVNMKCSDVRRQKGALCTMHELNHIQYNDLHAHVPLDKYSLMEFTAPSASIIVRQPTILLQVCGPSPSPLTQRFNTSLQQAFELSPHSFRMASSTSPFLSKLSSIQRLSQSF